MVQACLASQVMPTTEGGLDFKLNLTHVIDGFAGNEHSLPITPIYKDTIEFFSRSGINYTPTLIVLTGGPLPRTISSKLPKSTMIPRYATLCRITLSIQKPPS
jgi:hypothetical protein